VAANFSPILTAELTGTQSRVRGVTGGTGPLRLAEPPRRARDDNAAAEAATVRP
jgi:hypothetical protein